MRKAKGIAAIFAGLLLMFRAGAITVSADEGKGNNGDVKIHAVGTPTADNRNEPHVCDFYIDGFNFDNGQSGTWVIVGQAPTAGNVGRSGSWGAADNKGNWHTAPIAPRLADGHYKLTVNTGKGDGKHKVFWVECGTTANGQGNVPPTTPGQQNNGSNGNEKSDQPTQSKSKAGGSKSGTNSKSKKGGTATGTQSKSKASKNTKGGTKAGSVTGTHSVSKAGTKAGTKATNNASVASQGNNASGTNSMQTVSREESTTPATTPAPVIIPSGGTTLPIAVTLPGTTPVVEGTITIPAGAVITLPTGATITLPNGTILSGRIPNGTTLPANTVLPAGTTITSTGVLGFQSGPAMTGAVTPELENTAAAASQSTTVGGEETSPVAGVTSLPSTSTIADNGIWGALGLMLAGLGAFLLRKPQRRLN